MKMISKIGSIGGLSAIVFMMSIFLTSCNMFGSPDAKIDYIPVKESKEDKWGLMGPDGEYLFVDEFENAPSIVTEGVFSVIEGPDDLYTVYTAEKKPQVLKGCDGLKDVGMMAEGKMPIVRKNERITIINASGKTLFEIKPYKDKEISAADGYYNEGLLRVKTEDDKYGFIDSEGEFSIKPEYDFAHRFSAGTCIVGNAKKDDSSEYKYYLINKKGEKVYTFKEDIEILSVFDDFIVVEQGDRIRILNNTGEEKLKCSAKVKRISDIQGDKFVFYSGDAYGIMDMDGNVVVRAKYEEIEAYDENTFFCKKDDDKGYDVIDGKGNIITTLDVEVVLCVPGFGIIGGDENDGYIMDKKGERKSKKSFYDIKLQMHSQVYSDYFDSDAIAKVVVNLLDGDTFSKKGVKFGATAPNMNLFTSQEIDDLPSYKEEYSWEVADSKNYKISGVAIFSSNYKIYDYGYDDDYNWHSGYILNPNAEVALYGLSVELNKEGHTQDVGDALVSAMKQKGYNEVGKKKCIALFTQSNNIYLTLWKDDTVALLVMKNQNGALEIWKNVFNKMSDDVDDFDSIGSILEEAESEAGATAGIFE